MNLKDIIAEAYAEDIPHGDCTRDGLGLNPKIGRAKLMAKEDLILSGSAIFMECMHHLDPEIEMKWQFRDGDLVLNGQAACLLKGNLLTILKAERVALNFLGRFSGIATLTRCFVQETSGTDCKILDTRKTTPLYRKFEKQAVKDGGGTNHRMGLSDAVLIKDNHIRAAGSIEEAIARLQKSASGPIEVECRTLDEVRIAARTGVRRILLDNMTDEQMKEARALLPRQIETEASGNMNLQRIRKVAELGIDFISVGALTHSAPTADFSLMFEWASAEDQP